jgi:peroxiredoxin
MSELEKYGAATRTEMPGMTKTDMIAALLAKVMASRASAPAKLATLRAARDQFLPAEIGRVMDRAIDDLRQVRAQNQALKVGDTMPPFTLPDLAGTPVSAFALLERGPLVISFYRGSWCPYCNIEIQGLQRALPAIEAAGASVVAISPELPDQAAARGATKKPGFPILHDEANRVAKLFGIVFALPTELLNVYQTLGHGLADANGPAGATELALPATFVVGSNGAIRFTFVDEDYTRRADIDDIIAALKRTD